MENRLEKIKKMLKDYAAYAGESSVNRSLELTCPDDIYKSLDNQAAARVSVMSSYSGLYLRYYIIKAFMYGYYTSFDEKIIEQIDVELDGIAGILCEISLQEAIDCGYLG